MEEEVSSQTIFDNVLRVGPVVAVEVQRNCIDSLRLCQVVSGEHAAAETEVDFVHQRRDVCRQQVLERTECSGSDRSACRCAGSCSSMPAAVYQSMPDFGSTRLLSAITSREAMRLRAILPM